MSTDLSYVREDLRVTRLDTLGLRWTLLEKDGTPVNLDGATVTMTVRETAAQSSTLIFTEEGTHESPLTGGNTIIAREAADMAIGVDGETTKYWYELRLLEADGNDRAVFGGIFQVLSTPAPTA